MRIATLVAAFAEIVALLFTWQPGLASLYDDSVSYLIMAQAFAPYGDAGPAIAAAFLAEKYPPFFPLLTAFTGGAYDWRLAHALVAVCFGISVVTLAFLAKEICGSSAAGIAAAAIYAVMPGTWLNLKGILSEFPYMALTFGALFVCLRASERGPSRQVAIGLLLATIVLTRTIGVAMLVAIAISEFVGILRGSQRSRLLAWLPSIAIAIGTALLWYALRPAGGHDEYAARSSGVLRLLHDEPSAFAAVVRANASALLDAWLNALLIYWGEPWQPRLILACTLGAVGLAAAACRAWRGKVDGLYLLAFLAILLAWPFPGQMYRLAWPIVPLVMVEAVWAGSVAARRYLAERRFSRFASGFALVAFALCLPPLGYIVERAHSPSGARHEQHEADITEFYRIPARASANASAAAQLGILADLERIRSTTPENASVMWYTPGFMPLVARRRGVAMDIIENAAGLAQQVRTLRPDYIYFASIHPRDSAGRHGNPLAPWVHARSYTDVVWQRTGTPSGDLQSILLKVDAARLPAS